MAKIKVLHIVTRLGPGGVTLPLIALSKYVNKEKFDFSFIAGLERDLRFDKSKKALGEGMNLTIIPYLQREINPLKDFLSLVRLYFFIKRGDFDIVHTHTSKAGVLGRIASKLAKVSVIIHHTHGHVFKGMFNPFLTRIFILIEKVMALITDKIITLTQLGKEDLIQYGIAKPSKFVVIPSGIDLKRFLRVRVNIEEKKKSLGIRDDYPVIGTVAHLVERKGYFYLIKAIAQVKKDYPEIKVLIVGEGYLRNHLENRVEKLGMQKNFLFLGARDNVEEIYPLLDLFILSSVNEGMGRALLEAMACGKAVVATKVMGIPELVIDGVSGILVPPKDSDALAEEIINLLRDRNKLRKMGKAGREMVRACSYFDSKAMVKRIENLYQELI